MDTNDNQPEQTSQPDDNPATSEQGTAAPGVRGPNGEYIHTNDELKEMLQITWNALVDMVGFVFAEYNSHVACHGEDSEIDLPEMLAYQARFMATLMQGGVDPDFVADAISEFVEKPRPTKGLQTFFDNGSSGVILIPLEASSDVAGLIKDRILSDENMSEGAKLALQTLIDSGQADQLQAQIQERFLNPPPGPIETIEDLTAFLEGGWSQPAPPEDTTTAPEVDETPVTDE